MQILLLRGAAAHVLSKEALLHSEDHYCCHEHEGLHVLWIKELNIALKLALQGQRVAEIQVSPFAYHVLVVCSVLIPD